MANQLAAIMICFLVAPSGRSATPELFLQIPHSFNINAVVRSPDGRHLATGGYDHTVRVWSTDTGFLERIYEGHEDEVVGVAFNPKSQLLASGSTDKTVRVWDVPTGTLVHKLDAGAKAGSVAWNMTGSKIAVMTDTAVEIWDTTTWSTISKVSDSGMWTARRSGRLVFSADDRTLLADGGSGYGTKLIDVATGSVRAATDQTRPAPLGSHLDAMLISDEAARSWKLIDPSGLAVLSVFTPDPNTLSFAMSPDQRFVAATGGTYVSVLSAQSGVEQFHFNYPDLPAPGVKPICSVFSADSKKLFVGDSAGAIRTYELQQGTLLRKTPRSPHVHAVAYSKNGTLAIVSGSELLVMPSDGHFQSTLLHTDAMLDEPISLAAVNPDQTLVATTFVNGNGMLWDSKTGVLRGAAPLGHRFEVEDVTFSPSGKLFATGGCDARVLIFSVRDRSLQRELKDTDCAAQVRITADDQQAIVGYGGGFAFTQPSLSDSATERNTSIELWDIATGKKSSILKGLGDSIRSLDLSTDGQWIAAADREGSVAIWRRKDGSRLGSWRMAARVVRFSPNGQTLAIASDTSVRFFDLASHNIGGPKLPLTYPAGSLSFAPDGKRLAVAEGVQASLWTYPEGERICTAILDGREGYLVALPDGNYMSRGITELVSFRRDDQVYFYDQFDIKNNRPDKVLSAFGATDKVLIESYVWAFRKRLERNRLSEQAISDAFAPPQMSVEIGQPADDRAEVNVSARSDGSALADILIDVNGTGVTLAPGDRIPQGATKFTHRYSLSLSPGLNTVRIVARAVTGAESSSFDRQLFNGHARRKGDLYLLAVGVSSYPGSGIDLTYADRDAEAVAKFFGKQRGEYAHVHTTLLQNGDATRVKVLVAAAALKAAHQDDTVLVFLSGHGLLDINRDYYFGTFGIDFDKPGVDGLRYADLAGILAEIPARNKLLLIDSCHSGDVDSVPGFKPVIRATPLTDNGSVRAHLIKKEADVKPIDFWSATQIIESFFSDLRRGSGASVIASSSGTEYSFESEDFKGGLFTYALLSGLSTGRADANKDGHVSVQELKTYLNAKVLDLTAGAQHLSMRADNRFDDFAVGMPDWLLESWKHSEQAVEAVALSADGSTAVSGDHTGMFKMWDVGSGTVRPPINIGSFFPGASFMRDDRLFMWTGNGIADYDLTQQKMIHWQATRAGIYSGFFGKTVIHPRVHRFISRNLSSVTLIDTETNKVVNSWKGPQSEGAAHYAFSPDGTLVANVNDKDLVEVRDALSGVLRQTVTPKQPWALAFSSDNTLLAVGTGDNRVIVFDVHAGSVVASMGMPDAKNLLSAVLFCPGTTVIAGGSSDGSIRLWDAIAKSPNPKITFSNGDPVSSLAYDGTGNRLVVGGKSGFVRIFEATN